MESVTVFSVDAVAAGLQDMEVAPPPQSFSTPPRGKRAVDAAREAPPPVKRQRAFAKLVVTEPISLELE